MEDFMKSLPYLIGTKLDNDEINLLRKWIDGIIENAKPEIEEKYTRYDMLKSFEEGEQSVIDYFGEIFNGNENTEVRLREKFNKLIKE